MIVQLAFIFIFAFHLRHLLQGIKHGLNYSLVGIVDSCADFEAVGTNELILNSPDVDGELPDETGDALSLLAC